MDTAQTVARALGLFELLGKHKNLTAGRVIEMTSMHRSTTYRLLSTLVTLGYIRKDDDGGFYSLSPKILTLAASVRETKDIKEIAKPFIDDLHMKTHETIHLAVLDNDELVYLDKRESTKNLRVVMSSKAGSHAPLYCTGIGKILLAGMPENQFREYLKTVKFIKYTDYTLRDAGELISELDDIKQLGFAEDRGEHEDGVFCVAAPVTDAEGNTIAAFSVSLPSVRATEKLKAELIESVKKASKKISEAVS